MPQEYCAVRVSQADDAGKLVVYLPHDGEMHIGEAKGSIKDDILHLPNYKGNIGVPKLPLGINAEGEVEATLAAPACIHGSGNTLNVAVISYENDNPLEVLVGSARIAIVDGEHLQAHQVKQQSEHFGRMYAKYLAESAASFKSYLVDGSEGLGASFSYASIDPLWVCARHKLVYISNPGGLVVVTLHSIEGKLANPADIRLTAGRSALQLELEAHVKAERYEQAAQVRDSIIAAEAADEALTILRLREQYPHTWQTRLQIMQAEHNEDFNWLDSHRADMEAWLDWIERGSAEKKD